MKKETKALEELRRETNLRIETRFESEGLFHSQTQSMIGGMIDGAYDAALAIARRMLEHDYSVDFTVAITELSREEVENLR